MLPTGYIPQFERIAVLQQVFQDKSVHTALWMDDDSFVYDFDTPIEKWLKEFPGHDVIIGNITRDKRPQAELQLNSGVIIFRNTEFVQHLLHDILQDQTCQPYWDGSHGTDQECMNALLKNHARYRDKFAFVPSPKFNCQSEAVHDLGGHCDPWIFHTTGNKECLIPVAIKFIETGCSKFDFAKVCTAANDFPRALPQRRMPVWFFVVLGMVGLSSMILAALFALGGISIFERAQEKLDNARGSLAKFASHKYGTISA
jgi:hypothetical protein